MCDFGAEAISLISQSSVNFLVVLGAARIIS
jgi:hypothetical protein